MENNNDLVNSLMKTFMEFKRLSFQNIMDNPDLTHNQRFTLCILKKLSENDKVSLSTLRENLKLAPSTITPIVSSLEEQGYIKRNIDKADRRNIYIQITKNGKIYMDIAYKELYNKISEYIDYMGEKNTNDLIRLISKTTEYFKEKKEK